MWWYLPLSLQWLSLQSTHQCMADTHTQADYDVTLTLTHLHLATPPTWRPQGCPQLLFTPGWSQLLLFRTLLHPEAPPPPRTLNPLSQPLLSASQGQTSSPLHILPAQSPRLLLPPPTKPPDPSLSSSATSGWHQRRYLHDLKKCFYTSKRRKFHAQKQRMSSSQIF